MGGVRGRFSEDLHIGWRCKILDNDNSDEVKLLKLPYGRTGRANARIFVKRFYKKFKFFSPKQGLARIKAFF